MSDDLVKVTVCEGKYTFGQRKDGSCYALRYGETWREDIFDGLPLAMAHRIEELEAELAGAINVAYGVSEAAGKRRGELEAKLAYASVALQQALDSLSFAAHELAAQAHIPEEDSEMLWDRISLVTATIAKIKGEQP